MRFTSLLLIVVLVVTDWLFRSCNGFGLLCCFVLVEFGLGGYSLIYCVRSSWYSRDELIVVVYSFFSFLLLVLLIALSC